MTGTDDGAVAVAQQPAATGADLCRLTIDTGSGRVDLAVPVDTPMVEVLLLMVRQLDPGLTVTGGGTYALQRLGAEPIDEELTPAMLGLRDGDVLYLRPSDAPLPPIDLDDIVDGVGAAIRDHSVSWQPGYTRRLLLGLTAMVLAGMFIAVLLHGPVGWRVGAAGLIGLLLVVASGISSRALGDAGIGMLLGVAAVPFAGLTGALVPSAFGAAEWSAPHLLAGGAVATVAAALMSLVVAVARPLFVGVAVAAGFAALGGVLIVALETTGVGAAAAVAVLAFFASVVSPIIAVRVARLRTPQIPATAADLQHDIDPISEELVRARTAIADRYLSALFGSFGVVATVALAVLATGVGWASASFVVVLSLALLLRARALVNTWQRLATVLPGAVGLLLFALALASGAGIADRLNILVAGIACLSVLVAVLHRLPEQRWSPWWGRLADLLETLIAIAVAPLALAVLGVYARVRGMAG
ncbi:type VII secretion integral membrane protein EccD [Salinispora tropica]|uniref:type VII secretion integral membrane protein EccD n=1 Tax=Salinispora tropica TaxID=168695 RepID=UPI00048C72CF|nr:type VII secretion integral membrane protein EccD [Salinispora tropica]